LRLSLVTACPPHVAFSDAYKYRKRAPWSPSTRRPSIGAALADGRGETLFFASPVVGDNDVYAWDVAAIASASKKKEYRDVDDEEKNETVPARDEEGVSFRSPPVTKTALTAAPSKTTESGSLFAMRRHTDKVTCLAFLDQRNTRVVSGGNDKALVEWRKLERARDEPSARKEKEGDLEKEKENTWRAARSVAAPGGAIRALCVSETTTNARAVDNAVYNVYTAGSDGAVRAWEVSDETGFVLLRTFVGGHDGFGVCVRAVRLPVNFFSSPFFRHDAADAKTKTESVQYEDYVVSGCEGNAGGYWVAGDGSLKLWRAADGRCAQTVSAQRGDVTGIVVFGDKNAPDACLSALNEETRSASITNGKLFCRLVTASKDGTVAHFDLETNARAEKGSVKGATGEDGAEDGDGRPASFAWTKGFL
jgi:WD40 repeat protein